MPSPPESSNQNANDPSTGADHSADSRIPDRIETPAAAGDLIGGASSGSAAHQPRQPHKTFGQSRLAARYLMRALSQDLKASSTSARTRAKTAASYLGTKLRGSIRPETTTTVRNFCTRLAASLVKPAAGISATARKKRRHALLDAGRWKFALVSVFLVGLLLIGSIFVWALKDVPWGEIRDGTLKPVVVLETADGAPLVRQGPYQGSYAPYNQFPPHLIDAVLSIED